MFYVIAPNKVYKGRTLKEVNKALDGKMLIEDFHAVGTDFVCQVTDVDLDFIVDTKRISSLMFGNFFKRDMLPRNLAIAQIIMLFIILTRVMNLG